MKLAEAVKGMAEAVWDDPNFGSQSTEFTGKHPCGQPYNATATNDTVIDVARRIGQEHEPSCAKCQAVIAKRKAREEKKGVDDAIVHIAYELEQHIRNHGADVVRRAHRLAVQGKTKEFHQKILAKRRY